MDRVSVTEVGADGVVQFATRAIASWSNGHGSAGSRSGSATRSPKLAWNGTVMSKNSSDRLASPSARNGFGPVRVP